MVRLTLVLALLAAACESTQPGPCGGGSGDVDDIQGLSCGAASHLYVVDRLLLPVDEPLAEQFGLDLDGDPQAFPDNAAGPVLSALTAASANLRIQDRIDRMVDTGEFILLLRLRAAALTTATGVAMWTYAGAEPDPAPCQDANDATCRRHLEGDGSFALDPASQTDSKVVGQIVGGRYTGGPGTIGAPGRVGADEFDLYLWGARADVQVSETRLGGAPTPGKLGGAIPVDVLESDVLPWARALIADAIAADCTSSVPPCGCAAGSAGRAVIDLFDEAEPRDCAVTLDELRNNSLIAPLLVPDVDLFDADGYFNPRQDGVKDSLSVGLAFTAVGATFDYQLDPDEPAAAGQF